LARRFGPIVETLVGQAAQYLATVFAGQELPSFESGRSRCR
jgi:hypothetical protein